MNTPMNTDTRRPLRTSDLAAAGAPPIERSELRDETDGQPRSRAAGHAATAAGSAPGVPGAQGSEQLEALFADDLADRYRARWVEVQSGFVDDPRRAVNDGDELVAEVMQSLAESFAHERDRLEDELSRTGEAPTEALRVGLRRYRSFFERLLSL